MDAKLKERAQKVAGYRNLRSKPTEPQIKEVAEVYFLLTGKTSDCNSCNFYGFVNAINSILIKEPLIIKDMANAKGHFKHNASSKLIIRHGKNGTVAITPENINEGDNFEWASKEYPHLVEEVKAAKESAEDDKPATKTASTTKK